MHDTGTKLEIDMRLHALLGHVLGITFGVSAFKLACQQVAQPTFQKGHDTPDEEEPDPPAGGPEPNAWTFSYGPSVEAVVNQVHNILACLMRRYLYQYIPVN